jgi:DNA-binding phage protein
MAGNKNEKEIIKLLKTISETTNPFGIMDIAMELGYPRNKNGLSAMDYDTGINSQSIGKFISKSDEFEKYDRKSSSHVRWMIKNTKNEIEV